MSKITSSRLEAEDYIAHLLENGRETRNAILGSGYYYRANSAVFVTEYEAEFDDDKIDEDGEYIGDDDYDEILDERKNPLNRRIYYHRER